MDKNIEKLIEEKIVEDPDECLMMIVINRNIFMTRDIVDNIKNNASPNKIVGSNRTPYIIKEMYIQ